MKNRGKTIAVIVLLIIVLSANASMRDITYSSKISNAQIAPGIPAFLELGYSPSTLSSARDGIPVFAPSDELWVFSELNQPVSLNLTSNGNVVASVSLPPSTVALMYTFSKSDSEGNWTLDVDAEQNSNAFQVQIPFVNPSDHKVTARLTQYAIQDGQLNLEFSISATQAYDVEGCLSTNASGTVVVPLPSKLGTGVLSILSNLNTSSISFVGKLNQTFYFRFEVYHTYAYSGQLTNEFVSRDLQVIKSGTAFFTSASTRTVSLTNETTLRPGRYLFESFFESGLGLSVFESRALLLSDGNWYPLAACNPFQVTSSSISEKVNIAQNSLNWPRAFYLMYDVDGVDSYSVTPIEINLARIDFFGQPGNVKLTYLTYEISSSPDILTTSDYNGSIYVVLKSLPVSLNVSPKFGNESLSYHVVLISQQFSAEQINVTVGRLTVQLLGNTALIRGIPVVVTNGGGLTVFGVTDPNGFVVFYLPPDSYNVWINRGLPTTVKNASISPASTVLVQIVVGSSGLPWYLTELLGGLLGLGVLLNLWIWIFRSRRIKKLMRQQTRRGLAQTSPSRLVHAWFLIISW